MRPDATLSTPPSARRTEAQKRRRKELWLARADDRRALAERAVVARYEELKAAMARAGYRIGAISDLAAKLDDPVERFLALRARVERWDALWSITLRKRATRGKIIIGGAVLAQLAELVMDDPTDEAFLAAVVVLLDRRIPRVRDRLIVRELLQGSGCREDAFSLRPGGPVDEPFEMALAALGEGLSVLERGSAGAGYDHDVGDEADLSELDTAGDREGERL